MFELDLGFGLDLGLDLGFDLDLDLDLGFGWHSDLNIQKIPLKVFEYPPIIYV